MQRFHVNGPWPYRLFLVLALVAWSASGRGQYTAGDYISVATGPWNTLSTWKVYDGVSVASSPAAAAAPGAANRVWVRGGTTVTAVFGAIYRCAELFVEAGGRLYNNNMVATNLSYVQVYGVAPTYTGQIVVDGEIGNGATLDGISLSPDGANISLSGSGTVNLARIRKTEVTHPTTGASLVTSNFTIGMNVNLRFSTGTNTMLYNGCGAASNFHVTINAGATVSLLGAGGTGNVSIDGLAGADAMNLGGSITVNGSLIIPGIYYATTNNTSATYECRLTIGTGGYVRASQISALNSGVAWHRLIVNAGGTLELTGTPLVWPAYGTTNNQYNFDPGSLTIYSAAGAQDVRNVGAGYGSLRITGTGTKAIAGTLLVKGNLDIQNATGTPELDVTISNFQVTVWGNWTNYSQTGFNERTAQVVIGGGGSNVQVINTTGGEQFFNLRIWKTPAQPLVTMASNVQVASNLELGNNTWTGAVLDLNGWQLTLLNPAPTALTSATTGSFSVLRQIRSERTDNASRVRWDIGTSTGAHLVPFGTATTYIPFTFDLLSGDAGSVTMATYGTPPNNQPLPVTPTLVTALPSGYGLMPDNAEATVDRFWQIDVTGTPNTLLTFSYQASELPASPLADPLSLRAQRYNSAVPYWEDQLESVGNGSFFATANNVSAFGPFTLTHVLSPLPVELLRFDAVPEVGVVRLAWVTASELNSAYFEVLRSADGTRFETVATMNGAGTTHSTQTYRTQDRAPLPGLSYYKLRQHDLDGRYSDSNVVPVYFTGTASAPVLYPNPVREMAYLQGLPAGAVDLAVLDAAGRTVLQTRKNGDSDRFEWHLAQLPAGSYLLQVTGPDRAWSLRLLRD